MPRIKVEDWGKTLSVVCWLWRPVKNYRSQFTAEHVNIFRNMVERHLKIPHEVVCITDMPEGIDDRVRIVPIWNDHNEVQSPHGGTTPACYRRLKAFTPEMAQVIGPRFISMDLDVVIVDDITPLLSRKEDFIIWGSVLRKTQYNGSMWMMDAGARKEIYEDFDPITTPVKTRKAGLNGSDQAWMVYRLGKKEAQWTPEDDGVYAWRSDIKANSFFLLKDARIVFFQGHADPWDQYTQDRSPWILEHYK